MESETKSVLLLANTVFFISQQVSLCSTDLPQGAPVIIVKSQFPYTSG